MNSHSNQELQHFIRPRVRNLAGVTAGKSPSFTEKKGEHEPQEIIKLNANENPFGCSPAVNQALAEYHYFHRYPDATQKDLKALLADYAGVNPENIVVTGGADQLLDLFVRLFVDPGDEVIICVPTFGLCKFSTDLANGTVIDIPRDASFAVEVERVTSAITAKTKLIFLCNPNNPTGNITEESDIVKILETGIPVIVDEAYYEFSKRTMIPYLDRFPNLLIVRTLSKWAGLAGFRIGYGIVAPEISEYLMKVKLPFNVPVPSLIALQETMKHKNVLMEQVEAVIAEREKFFNELQKLDFVRPYLSEANFIYCSILNGSAAAMNHELETRGILIHHFDTPLLRNGLRISLGKPEENTRVLTAIKEMGESLKQ